MRKVVRKLEYENFILNSKPLEVASYKNYKEATFLISVLDQPDLYGRIIPKDSGEKYCKTIIGYPVVAKLKKNIFGQISDFDGHAIIEVKAKNGKKQKKFTTHAIGSVLDAWTETRDVEGYEGEQECILCKTKLWTSRFPEYFKVFDKLWEQGKIQSSWELTATKVETEGEFKIYKIFEFIGTCCLGSTKTPAVPGAGVIEYAELEDYETELAEALEKDIADLDIENEDKEVTDLAEKEKKDTPVEDTEKKEKTTPETVDDSECKKKKVTAECDPKKKKSACAEVKDETEEKEEEAELGAKKKKTSCAEVETPEKAPEVASLTDCDLFRKINEECRKAVDCCWGYISYWFPEEKTVWYKPDNAVSQLDYKLFTYEVVDDEVTVSEPQDVKLTVSVTEVNEVIAEKDEKIGTLTAELEIKDEAVIKAGEKINKLNVEVSELKPYKEAAEKAEQERIEAEIAEAKETLKNNMLKTKLFTEEEIAETEIAELIEFRNETAIKNLIAERYIASFDKEDEVSTDTASYEEKSNESVANLESDDIDEDPSVYMRNFLKRK